eukprot:5654602-Prymnesium_polylepis.2
MPTAVGPRATLRIGLHRWVQVSTFVVKIRNAPPTAAGGVRPVAVRDRVRDATNIPTRSTRHPSTFDARRTSTRVRTPP